MILIRSQNITQSQRYQLKSTMAEAKDFYDFEELLKDYDYVRLVTADVIGQHRGKTVPVSHIPKIFRHGTMVFSSIQIVTELTTEYSYCPQELAHYNTLAKAFPKTLVSLPWAGKPKQGSGKQWRVGSVLCEILTGKGEERSPVCSRSIARKQLQRLQEEFGYKLLSASEHEFIVLDAVTKEPVFPGRNVMNHLVQSEFEPLFFNLMDKLDQCGIKIESYSSEYASGQFEITVDPVFGIKSADDTFMFRQVIKEMCAQEGYMATFMTKVFEDGDQTSSTHFNHSLYDSDGVNVFYDSKGDKNMSEVFRYWTAGVIEHLPALTALCCPTPNCYRRLGVPLAPSAASWGYDSRLSTLRAKAYTLNGSYLENRLPSSAANPYLVMAATVAAGMDGLRRKLKLPEELSKEAKKLPSSLEEALSALESDDELKQALGEKFVTWFSTYKRETELRVLSGFNRDVINPTLFAKEKEMYLKFI